MIDFHTHPVLVREMWERYPDLERIAHDVFYIRNRPQPLRTFILELDVSGLDRAVVLPIDARTAKGEQIYTNEQIAELCQMSDRFVGFASVDPHRPDALDALEHAIFDLGLRGLKLAPSTQGFRPDDPELAYRVYERAQALGIPIVFHAGMSWEPNVKAYDGHPRYLEPVAHDFPKLHIVIAHFAWPWVLEAVMLALKYPNVYLDTSCLYFDNPKDFISFVMRAQVPLTVIERSLRNQVVFGSNYPRVEIKNMAWALRAVGLSEECLRLIFEGNARRLLREE